MKISWLMKMTDKICNNCGKRVDNKYNYCPECKSQSFRDIGEITTVNNDLVHKIFYWPYPTGSVISKTKLLSVAVFLYLIIFWFYSGANLIFIPLAIIIALIIYLIGLAFHMIKPTKSKSKIKYNDYGLVTDIKHLLFYWQNKNGNFIVSKTKIISFLVFLLFALLGSTIFKEDMIFLSIVFGIVFEIPVFAAGYIIHKLTNRDNSKPKLADKKQIKRKSPENVIEKDNQGTIPEYEGYKNEIEMLNKEFSVKEKHVSELIEKRFAPPQLTYTRFIGVVNKSKELFNHQSDSALTMISLASEYSSKIEQEIKSKIDVLDTIIDKLDDLANELVLTMEDSNDEEIDDLFDNINNLIDSVKDYE